MPAWSYHTLEFKDGKQVTIDGRPIPEPDNSIDLPTYLNQLGGKGWEAIHVERDGGKFAFIFFKCPER